MELSLQIALEIVLWEGRSQTFLSHQMENKQLRFFSLLFVFQEEWGWTPLSWLTEAVVILTADSGLFLCIPGGSAGGREGIASSSSARNNFY